MYFNKFFKLGVGESGADRDWVEGLGLTGVLLVEIYFSRISQNSLEVAFGTK